LLEKVLNVLHPLKAINAKKPKTDNKIIVPFFIFFVVFLFVVPLNNFRAYCIDFKIS
jgi:hypothetical protein